MRQEVIAVAIAFIATRDIGVDAYFSKVLTRSKPAILFGHKETIDKINSQWCPHMVLGDAKIEEFASIKQKEDDAKNAEIAKKEASLAAESAKLAAAEIAKKEEEAKAVAAVAAVALAKKEEEAKAVAAAAAASAAEAVKAAAAALAKKEEEAKAIAAAAAASAAEAAKAAAAALAKKQEEELEEAAEEAMAVAAEAARKEAADAEVAQVAIRAKKQEELSRLAEVASKANAIEQAEKSAATATASSSSSPTNPIQLQDILLAKKKTVSEQLLSADVVSAPVSDDVDIFDIMQASAEAEAAQVCVGSLHTILLSAIKLTSSLHDHHRIRTYQTFLTSNEVTSDKNKQLITVNHLPNSKK
jgi:hypothetical protein